MARSTRSTRSTLTAIDKCLIIVYLATVIDMLGVSLTIPVNVPYVRYLSLITVKGASTATDRGTDECHDCPRDCIANATAVLLTNSTCVALPDTSECRQLMANADANSGLPFLLYNVGAFIGTFWMPVFSDRCGRKLAITVSIFGSLSGFILQAVATNFAFLVLARLWGGLFGATATVTNAFIVDLVPPEKRAKMFGLLFACILSAFSGGPLIGAALIQLGIRTPYIAASLLSFLAIFLCHFYVKDPKLLLEGRSKKKDKDENDEEKEQRGSSLSSYSKTVDATTIRLSDDVATEDKEAAVAPLRNPRVWLIAFQGTTSTIGFMGMFLLIPVHLITNSTELGVYKGDCPGKAAEAVGVWFALMSLVAVFVQVPTLLGCFPKLVKRCGLLQTASIGTFLTGVSIVFLPYYSSVGLMFISIGLAAMGNGLQQPVAQTFLSTFAKGENTARTLAIGTIATSVGNIFGPFLTQLLRVDPYVPFWICGISSICSSLSLFVLFACCSSSDSSSDDDDPRRKKTSKTSKTSKQRAGASGGGEEKEESAAAKMLRHRASVEHDTDAVPLLNTYNQHPASWAGASEYESAAIAELTNFLVKTLRDKNIHYGFIATEEWKRRATVQMIKDLIDDHMPQIPDQDCATENLAFKRGWINLMHETGHDDWVLGLPGMTEEKLARYMATSLQLGGHS